MPVESWIWVPTNDITLLSLYLPAPPSTYTRVDGAWIGQGDRKARGKGREGKGREGWDGLGREGKTREGKGKEGGKQTHVRDGSSLTPPGSNLFPAAVIIISVLTIHLSIHSRLLSLYPSSHSLPSSFLPSVFF